MADIILHSGSFVDRNDNEISITFFKRDSAPEFTVTPIYFEVPYVGSTETITVTNYDGEVSITGLSENWITYTMTESSGVVTITMTVAINTNVNPRFTTFNVRDDYGYSEQVSVLQGGFTFRADPSSFHYGGSGSTNTFDLINAPANLTYFENEDWVTVSNLTSSSVDITTSYNDSPYSRETVVTVYEVGNVNNKVDITVYQDPGQSSLSVSPRSITYLPSGGTYGITATWTAGNEPTATVTYVQGDPGWMTPTGNGIVTGNTKEWAWTASANNTGSSRTALITVTNGLQSEYVTVSQSSGGAVNYIRWTPYLSYGSFSINSSYYSYRDYQSCYFSDFSGTITASAFYWDSIVTVETNASQVERDAFGACGSLVSANLMSCENLGSNAFYNCSQMYTVKLPMCSVIGEAAFDGCSALEIASFPVCSSIGSRAFLNCSSLMVVDLPQCREIRDTVFMFCPSLSQVSLPMVERIGVSAFGTCTTLSSIVLPRCSRIDSYAFHRCSNLYSITLGYSSVCSIENSYVFQYTRFDNSLMIGDIFVPSSLVSAYKSARYWSAFSNLIKPIQQKFTCWPSLILVDYERTSVRIQFENVPSGGITDSIRYSWCSLVYDTSSTAILYIDPSPNHILYPYYDTCDITFYDQDNMDNYIEVLVKQKGELT